MNFDIQQPILYPYNNSKKRWGGKYMLPTTESQSNTEMMHAVNTLKSIKTTEPIAIENINMTKKKHS